MAGLPAPRSKQPFPQVTKVSKHGTELFFCIDAYRLPAERSRTEARCHSHLNNVALYDTKSSPASQRKSSGCEVRLLAVPNELTSENASIDGDRDDLSLEEGVLVHFQRWRGSWSSTAGGDADRETDSEATLSGVQLLHFRNFHLCCKVLLPPQPLPTISTAIGLSAADVPPTPITLSATLPDAVAPKARKRRSAPTNGAASKEESSSSLQSSPLLSGPLPRCQTPAILLHGFGASLFSWHAIQGPLAALLGAPVLSFDRPGFGLAPRPLPSASLQGLLDPQANPYAIPFSTSAAQAIARLLASSLPGEGQTGAAGPAAAPRRAVLVAHSAGSLPAVAAVLAEPSLFSALILIAPAIVPPVLQQPVPSSPLAPEPPVFPTSLPTSLPVFLRGFQRTLRSAGRALQVCLQAVAFCVSLLMASLSLIICRSVLALQLFPLRLQGRARAPFAAAAAAEEAPASGAGENPAEGQGQGLASAAPEGSRNASTGNAVLAAFEPAARLLVLRLAGAAAAAVAALATLCLCCARGLHAAVIVLVAFALRTDFARRQVQASTQALGVPLVRKAWHVESGCTAEILEGYTKPLTINNWDRALVEVIIALFLTPRISSRLQEIKIPVMVVTGDDDRFVPPEVSRQVAAAIPGSSFHVIPCCGHLPHEECPHQLLAVIAAFLEERVWSP